MKANEAPEKIYISPKVFNIGEYVTKVLTTKYIDNIEYTRTDAFIERACEWLEDFCNEHYIMSYSDSHEIDNSKELIEIFKSKMEE